MTKLYLALISLVLSSVVFAEVKVAVIDVEAAVYASQQAKQIFADLKQEFAAQETELKTLAATAQTLKTSAQNSELDQKQRSDAASEYQSKVEEIKFRQEKLKRAVEQRQQERYRALGPLVQQLMQGIIKQGDYDIVLRREATLISKQGDLTAELTERLNAASGK